MAMAVAGDPLGAIGHGNAGLSAVGFYRSRGPRDARPGDRETREVDCDEVGGHLRASTTVAGKGEIVGKFIGA